jgi:hypothetical protein
VLFIVAEWTNPAWAGVAFDHFPATVGLPAAAAWRICHPRAIPRHRGQDQVHRARLPLRRGLGSNRHVGTLLPSDSSSNPRALAAENVIPVATGFGA